MIFEKDRDVGCLGTIRKINEEARTFILRIFSWHRKKRRVWFETGKDIQVKEKDVWRMAKRMEFERVITYDNVRLGQTVRVNVASSYLDFCGFVQGISSESIRLQVTSGYKERIVTLLKSDITDITEICSSDIFYRLREVVGGEQTGRSNLT